MLLSRFNYPPPPEVGGETLSQLEHNCLLFYIIFRYNNCSFSNIRIVIICNILFICAYLFFSNHPKQIRFRIRIPFFIPQRKILGWKTKMTHYFKQCHWECWVIAMNVFRFLFYKWNKLTKNYFLDQYIIKAIILHFVLRHMFLDWK